MAGGAGYLILLSNYRLCSGLSFVNLLGIRGGDIPNTLQYIQGVTITKDDDVYKVLKTRIDGSTDAVVPQDHPIHKFLTRISDLVMQIIRTGDTNDAGFRARSIKLATPTAQLYRIVHEYLQGRVWSETYPERKLIIRTPKRPTIKKDGVDLSNARVELVGDFFEIFNISTNQSVGREYTWQSFCDSIPLELRTNCVAGLQYLTAEVLQGSNDNYHVVTSVERDKSFRLFVSKVVTYVSQKTEIDIYVLQMRTKEYGDPHTTRLLKAISVGLRFRFLLLEEQSEFRPEKLGHPIVTEAELKARVTELLGQMDLVLRDATEADLQNPDLLILIWGKGQEKKVQEMMGVWERARVQLYTAAEDILSSAGDDFERKKDAFVKALESFCAKVEQMNRDFTSRVLSLLAEQIQKKIGPAPSKR